MPFSEFMQYAAKTYALHNRGTDIGEQRCEIVSDRHIKMTLRMPHPDDFWFGAFYSLGRQFLTWEKDYRVYYDDAVPRRDLGGEVTIIHIEW